MKIDAMATTQDVSAYRPGDLKFEIFSQDFVRRVAETQPMPTGRKRLHYIFSKQHIV